MDIKILRNKVYLALLSFYDGGKMPTTVELGNKIGITRQTASKELKKLINENIVIVNDEKILEVKNNLNLNVDKIKNYLETSLDKFDAIELYNILYENNDFSRKQLGEKLAMARQTRYNDRHSVVYGIIYEGRLKYIGSTCHYKQRRSQHIHSKRFPVQLADDNFIILIDNVSNPFPYENWLINALQPEWNISKKQLFSEESFNFALLINKENEKKV